MRSGESNERATKCCPEGVWGPDEVGRGKDTARREGLDRLEGVGVGENDYCG